MKFLTNRIVLSLVVIAVLTYVWEFYAKPVSGPLYNQAVQEYKNQNYRRSLELLQQANQIDPNDATILSLMGWNALKLGEAQTAEKYFERAYFLDPEVEDILLGYSYTELALGKDEQASKLLQELAQKKAGYSDVYIARGTLFRNLGHNREAAEAFKAALQKDPNDAVALKNLKEITGTTGDPRTVSLDFAPLERPQQLTYRVRVEGDYFAWEAEGSWKPAYLSGVNLTPALPGHYPADPGDEPSFYSNWLKQISEMGANSVRVYTLLPPGFYRALYEFNSKSPRTPLWLIQGITLDLPPGNDLFNGDYYASSQKEIRATLDAMHGRGDVPRSEIHLGGLYNTKVAPWVAAYVLGRTWPSYVVVENNQLHPDLTSFQGTYIEVPSGTATEIFLAQMIDHAARYEEETYNWQHPIAFLNWSPLDPLHHPTESNFLEELALRRNLGERISTPTGPFENDDEVSVDPTHLRPRPRFPAGYFSAYNIYPFYPDFVNYDPKYRSTRDAEGPNPFLGYLRDLKAHHANLPLLVTEYGTPTSLGVSHLNPSGWNQGGLTEIKQGEFLARLTASIAETNCAGGLVEGWIDQWYRQNWLVRDFEVPGDRKRLWLNVLTPEANQGLGGFATARQEVYRLRGDASRWTKAQLLYEKPASQPLVKGAGDRFDPALRLLRVYADSDEAYLYLRIDVEKLDNDGNGRGDWTEANYLIALRTTERSVGSTQLPFVSGVRFPAGVNYVIRLGQPQESKIMIAPGYNPYQTLPVPGLPGETQIRYRIPFLPGLKETAEFEETVVETNRRRYGRDGRAYPVVRSSRSPLIWGTLEQGSTEYNTLAQWYANPKTNMIELRFPWGLLQVTDPSSLQVLGGIDLNGTFYTERTSGIRIAVISFRPHLKEVADVLPAGLPLNAIGEPGLQRYTWAPWDQVEAKPYLKDSYSAVRRAFISVRAQLARPRGRTSPPKSRK